MVKKVTTLLLCLFVVCSTNAQELQFNQWQFAPALLNPSLTGAYEGSFRVGGIIKDKWGSWDSQSWKTIEAYVDAPIIRGFRKSDWIGIGIAYDVDQAGTLKFNQQYQRASIAYHFGFGKKLKSSFSVGAQFINGSQKLGNTDAQSEDWLAKSNPSATKTDVQLFWSGQDNLEASYNAWTGSLGYRAQQSKKNSIALGLAVSQFLPNDDQAFLGSRDELPTRFTAYFSMNNKTGKKTTFEPQVVYTRQGVNDKIYLQGIFGYQLKNKMMLKYGVGLNAFNNDINLPIYLGIEKGSLRVGLAYDVDLGVIAATSTYGGLELAASYIHVLAKKPEPKPVLICPRL